jgi:hypothetical protein
MGDIIIIQDINGTFIERDLEHQCGTCDIIQSVKVAMHEATRTDYKPPLITGWWF